MRIGILIVVFSLLGLYSCEDASEPSNHPPEIISMTATPATILAGNYTIVSVVATDADRDALSYTYYAEKGSLSDQVESSIKWWISRDSSGTYLVNCIISDGVDTASDSVSILVNPRL